MRNTLILALVSVAVFLETDAARSKIMQARVALNRLKGKIPQRVESVEKELLSRRLDERTIKSVVERLGEELALTSDYRASAEYRCEAVKVLLGRALSDCRRSTQRK
jgi:CO/xanthine dehydrogenase FAD-binding subunit